jgi:hypothetical protein
MFIENIVFNDEILAIIVRKDFSKPGIHFLTSDDYSQQLAYMRHPAGKKIQPHLHNAVNRKVTYTQEVLFIKKGKLRVDFYSREQKYLESKILEAGDIILLATGGHGFEVLEELEMFEVKQGPYVELEDKVRFTGISSDQAIVKNDEEK